MPDDGKKEETKTEETKTEETKTEETKVESYTVKVDGEDRSFTLEELKDTHLKLQVQINDFRKLPRHLNQQKEVFELKNL